MTLPPRAVIELPLEGQPVVRFHADTAEDEARLMFWLFVHRRAAELLEAAAEWAEESAA